MKKYLYTKISTIVPESLIVYATLVSQLYDGFIF